VKKVQDLKVKKNFTYTDDYDKAFGGWGEEEQKKEV